MSITGPIRDPVDPAPFVAWARERMAQLGADTVLELMGWAVCETNQRRFHRWRNESRWLEWDEVYEALHHAGAQWWAMYPERVEDDVSFVKGKRRGKPRGVHGKMTDAQVRAAHVLYEQQGLSLRALGALLYERFGYASANACANSLSYAFIRLNLPRRDRIKATVKASTVHGKASRAARAAGDPAFLAHRKATRTDTANRPRCAGYKVQPPRKGQPCQNLAQIGSDFCIGHDPARAQERAERLAAARERLPA